MISDIDLYNGYDYELFAVNNGDTDNVTPTHQPMLIIASAIIETDKDITVYFNSTSNPARPLLAIDSPLNIIGLSISRIFVKNTSGSVAAVAVTVIGNKAPNA